MLDCGFFIDVEAGDGALVVKFLALCGGRFIVVTNGVYQRTARNGHILADWRSVVRELVALTVPRSLALDKAVVATGVTAGLYRNFALTYPLPVGEIAGLVGESAAAVRELLSDLAVQAE